MTVESKKESVWKGEWRSGGMGDIEGGGERKREEEKESVWEKAGVRGRVGRMRERERG